MGRRDITTKLPLPPLVVQESASEPLVLVAVVTIVLGPGVMAGKVTFGPVSVKSLKRASLDAVAKAAWAMPTSKLTPAQSARVATPFVLVAVVTIVLGPGGMAGKVTFGPVSVKSLKRASLDAVAKAAWAMPTSKLTPAQSARVATPFV